MIGLIVLAMKTIAVLNILGFLFWFCWLFRSHLETA